MLLSFDAGAGVTRRGVLQGSLAGALSAGISGSPVSSLSPPASGIPNELMVTRAKQLRDELVKAEVRLPFPKLNAPIDSARARRYRGDRTSRENALRPPSMDIVLDWAKANPQKSAPLKGKIAEWISILEADTNSGYVPLTSDREMWEQHSLRMQRQAEISQEIMPHIAEAPWASMDWFEVFGERVSALEWQLHQNLGLPLYDAQKLTKLIFSPLTRDSFGEIIQMMLRGDSEVALYSKRNIQEFIKLISAFAPNLAYEMSTLHLDVGSAHKRDYLLDRAVNHFHDVFLDDNSGVWPDIRRVQPRQVTKEWWERGTVESFLNGYLETFKEILNDLRDTELILSKLPESTIRDHLLKDTQKYIEYTEFEMATMPSRLAAEKWRVQAGRNLQDKTRLATMEDSERLANGLRELNAQLPAWDSNAWFTFRPPQIDFDKKIVPEPAINERTLSPLETNLKWIQSLNSKGIQFSQNLMNAISAVEKIAAAIPLDKPNQEATCESLVQSRADIQVINNGRLISAD